MNIRLLATVLIVGLVPCCLTSAPATGAETITSISGPSKEQQAHIDWVKKIYGRMLTIKPGMTRAQLLEVFETDGGVFTPLLKERFVSRECLYFKVDVEFQAVGRPSRDSMIESKEDRIIKISMPYLQTPFAD